jgi:hypothetical protein
MLCTCNSYRIDRNFSVLLKEGFDTLIIMILS